MIAATIFRLVLVCLYGLPIARALDRRLRGFALAGAGLLVGCGAIALDLFFLSVFGIRWTRTSMILGALPVLVVSCVAAAVSAADVVRRRAKLHWVDALIAIPILGHFFFATWTGMYEWDFFGIWGLKGRTFFDHGGIDWHWVRTSISHPDYAPLVPLMYDFVSIGNGRWDERSLGLIFTFMCAALILIARELLAEEYSLGAIAALAIVFPALNMFVGLAEGAVMAFGCAALLLIRRGDMALGAVLLGFAAWSKNEGMALLGVTIVALILVRRWRDALRLWPAVAIISPWLVTRSVQHLQTDFVDRWMFQRMWTRIVHPAETVKAFVDAPPDQPLFWIAVLLCIVIYARTAFTRERFLTLALLGQVFLFFAQGIATKAPFGPHVSLTMNRLPQQLAPAFAYLAVVLLLLSLDRTEVAVEPGE